MDLPTVNNRGSLSSSSEWLTFNSEANHAKLYLSKLEGGELAKAIITKKSKITTADNILIDLEFNNVGEVTIIWVAKSHFERVTFDEPKLLVALIDTLLGQ